MPNQRIVISLPEHRTSWLLAIALDLRTYYERRGYVVSIRYGEQSFDDDVTPLDGVELPAVLVTLSDYGGAALKE